MKPFRFLLQSVILFSSLGLLGQQTVLADDSGYWGTTSGKVWKSGFGGCWRTLNWTPDSTGCGDEETTTSPAPAPETDITGHFWADDQDFDGVSDADDRCPFTPEGIAVDSNGCANDNDGDGVPDYLDECPETPLGRVVDTRGCHGTLVSMLNIHFAFDSSLLTPDAKRTIDDALAAIQKSTSSNLIVEGHTDSTGTDIYNQGLSERRAGAVVEYLISKGVSSSRLKPVGMGENFPVASNDTREGRQENRRVEVIAK